MYTAHSLTDLLTIEHIDPEGINIHTITYTHMMKYSVARHKQPINNASGSPSAFQMEICLHVVPAHKSGRVGEAWSRGPTSDYLLNTYRCVPLNGGLLSSRWVKLDVNHFRSAVGEPIKALGLPLFAHKPTTPPFEW